jgi:hypothetical protein
MSAYSPARPLCGIALGLLLLTATAAAQGIPATGISATVDLEAVDLPATFTYVYEGGRLPVTYSANGVHTHAAAQGLGNLLSVAVFGTTVHYGIIDNETTPGTGRVVLVSFTSRQEAGGTIGLITAEAED